jgi:hypothetical protein
VKGLTPFLKQCGYNPKKDLTFIPISALHGHNVQKSVTSDVSGRALLCHHHVTNQAIALMHCCLRRSMKRLNETAAAVWGVRACSHLACASVLLVQ